MPSHLDELSLETGEADAAQDHLLPPAPISSFARFRAVTFLALGPLVGGYACVVVVLAVVTGTASNAGLTTAGVLRAGLPSWLAAHQVPIGILGVELGVLPLLPTIGIAVLTAKAAGHAAERLDLRRPGQGGKAIATVAVAHAIAGVVVAELSSATAVKADPLAALYYPALISALAATLGVARRCGIYRAITQRADAVAVEGLRAGVLAVALFLTAGGAVLTFGLLTSIETAKALFPAGAGNATGMLLLSIGYLPNAMIAATSFAAGPGFSFGAVTVAPLEFHGGRLPDVPLLAALPEAQASWWPALFVLPLAVGVAVGRRLRHVHENPVARLRAVAIATGVVAICSVLLAGLAGGRLGRGAFDPVSMRATALSIALVVWTAVPGTITAWLAGPHAAAEPMPGLIDTDDETHAPHEEIDDPADDTTDDEVNGTSDDETGEEEIGEGDGDPEVPEPRGAAEESDEVARD
jgi:hypothetical protein